MDNGSFVNHNLTGIPFTVRFGILRLCRNHVIERCRLTIAVNAELSIGVISIVKHLVFRSRLPDRNKLVLAIVVNRNFLCKVEYTRISTLGNFVFKGKFEILELVRKENIAAVYAATFSVAGTFKVNCAIVNIPV